MSASVVTRPSFDTVRIAAAPVSPTESFPLGSTAIASGRSNKDALTLPFSHCVALLVALDHVAEHLHAVRVEPAAQILTASAPP